ncbi:FAD-dependent oxidoreductase [Thermococcus paralvinellae]|uniref:Putative glutamate synthase subunit beta n=1 Tax=Thermococcus paralvinellae TaxID=582419 RepID=W0I796_9EURY|nr:FAD-dependent oxidoreductase [Thermococcus paralvinellae]AHF80335.1 putative glutamate synthase subunit beta [Thermococcus paralvinellae]
MKFYICKEKEEPKEGRIAIIGAGPAGLSAAGYLACKGYPVEVFDKMPEGGGMIAFGIPESRIPIKTVREGVKDLERLGVKFNFRTKVVYDNLRDLGDEFVERVVYLEELLEDFDAILIATGAWRPKKLKIEGIELEGVWDALTLLYKIKLARIGYIPWSAVPEMRGKEVVIVGAGYTAVDVALEAKSLGAKKMTMVYRRGLENSYAKDEIKRLINEGVNFIEFATPARILGEDEVKEVEFVKTKLVNGKVIPTDETFKLSADIFVYAIGQFPTPPIKALICANEKILRDAGIFLAGDVLAPRNIGAAIREGTRAAKEIEEWLISKEERPRVLSIRSFLLSQRSEIWQNC